MPEQQGGSRVRGVIDSLIGKAREMAERAGKTHARALARLMQGVSRALLGDYDQGVVLCDLAAAQLRDDCTGVAWELDNASFFAAFSLVQCGRLRELGERLPSLLEDARSRGDLYAEVFLRMQCSWLLALAAGDPERAEVHVATITEVWSVERFLLQHAWQMIGFPGAYSNYYDLVGENVAFQAAPTSFAQSKHDHGK